MKDVYGEIEKIVGKEYLSDKDFMKAAYSRNVDSAFPDRWADIIVRPESTEEVSEIIKIANKYKIPITPRGGGADLVGGSTTDEGILMDLTRMNKIVEIDEDNFYCVVECGITWGDLVSQLHKKGYTTGVLGPGSGYSATVGGGLSNSTAGFGSTKYGLIPDICLGVEVVLGDGSIIKTGAAANKYAKPFCRYGVAPDFTGLFMGDVGTMGIKTRVYLRICALSPCKKRKDYKLNKDDYNQVFEIFRDLQKEVKDGMTDVLCVPTPVIQLLAGLAKNKPAKRPKLRGSVFILYLEADDQRILDIYEEKIDEIMKRDNRCRDFEYQEIDLDEPLTKDFEFNLKFAFHYFNKYISIMPEMISCTTCHKLPISFIAEAVKKSFAFDAKFSSEYPEKSVSLFATIIYLLPNGHCVFVGGLNAQNRDETHEQAMKIWHKKIRAQVKYGAAHYWLGESISQSLTEAGTYDLQFEQLFRDLKKVVDPNFLLSPNKFHMYVYDDKFSNYLIEDEPYD